MKPSTSELFIAVSTVWLVTSALLVIFMQAGFAFLEAGLTRMKNAAHVAGKNVIVFSVAAVCYWAVGFGFAFGDGGSNGLIGLSGFFPGFAELTKIGAAPFSWFYGSPAAAGYLFEVAFAGVSLAIVWGSMAERAKLWVYFAFGIVFTLIYSVVSHWIWYGGQGAYSPVTNGSDREDDHVLPRDVRGVLHARETGFEESESGLHEDHEQGRGDQPDRADGDEELIRRWLHSRYTSTNSRSGIPVRLWVTFETCDVQTRPSPDSCPLRADSAIAATTRSASPSRTMNVSSALGRNRDSNTRPRYSCEIPRCRP